MGTDYKQISEDAIGQPVQAAGLFEPAGAQYSSSRVGGGGGSGILMAISKHSDRGEAAAEANLPKWMIIAVTDEQIHVFEAKEKIGHYELAEPALAVLDRSSTTAEKHLSGLGAEGLSLLADDGRRVEVEAPRMTGHGMDVINLLVG